MMITAILAAGDDGIALARALLSLVPAAMEGLVREVIVIDDTSCDEALAVADDAGCTIVKGQGSETVKKAAAAARGDWLMFLAPASTLEDGWHGEVLSFIDSATLSGQARQMAATFRLGLAEYGWRARCAEWMAAARSRLFAAPCAEQGLVVSRAFYTALGGHRALPAMAEVDLGRRIGRKRLVMLRSRAVPRGWRGSAGGFGRALRETACLALLVLRLPPRLIGRWAA